MYAEERRAAIVDEVRTTGRVRVVDLAQRFAVAPETIRRDLDLLEADFLLQRVHGGAIRADRFEEHESSLTVREVENAEAKRAIAAAAMAFVPENGGSMILDAGSTTGALATRLVQQPGPTSGLSVVTNSVPAALTLSTVEQHSVLMVGGSIRPITASVVGPTAVELLARIRADVAFLGTNGISSTYGLTTPDPLEAAAKRGMVAAARRRIVLADSSKFGRDYFVTFAALKDIDALITDRAPTGPLAEALSAHEIQVVVA